MMMTTTMMIIVWYNIDSVIQVSRALEGSDARNGDEVQHRLSDIYVVQKKLVNLPSGAREYLTLGS